MYIDTELALKRNLTDRVTVYLNGEKIKGALSAKSGRNGFVKFFTMPARVVDGEAHQDKKRGFVKISFNLRN